MGTANRFAAGDADNAKNLDLGEGRAGDENPERVAIEVGGREADAVVEEIEEVVGDDAFEDIGVPETEADPEAVKLGAAEEGFAFGRKGFVEFLDEIDGLNLVERDGLKFAVAGEEFGGVAAAKAARIQIGEDARAADEKDDGLLVSRGWGRFSRQSDAFNTNCARTNATASE